MPERVTISMSGGGSTPSGLATYGKSWHLYFDGKYIAETSVEENAKKWEELAWLANRA